MLTKKQLKDAARCCDGLCELCSCNKTRMAYQDCIREAAKTALAYGEMLERLELSAIDNFMSPFVRYRCPICRNYKTDGHAPDCELAALLKESEVEHDA